MTDVRHTFSFRFDKAFIQRALRRDRNWGVLKVLLLYAIAAPLVVFGLDAHSGLTYGILGGGFVATMTFVVALFAKAANSVHAIWLRQSPSLTIRYELDDDGFSIHMDHASSRFAWQGLRQLWRYPDVWLIEVVRKQSAFFPPEAVDAEALAFVERKCREGGAKV
jgi:hypothetical protein